MNQYHFSINFGDSNHGYKGPPCPRVVECKKCKRIMEAPLLSDDKPKKCCIRALKKALQVWLNDDYAPYMEPSPVDMAMAGLSLDALVWDMERNYPEGFLEKHPEILKERDKFLNNSIAHRLRQQGFLVEIKPDGTITGLSQAGDIDSEGNCDMLELEIEPLRSDRLGDHDYSKDFEDKSDAWGMGPISPIDVEDLDPEHKDWT